MTLKHRIYFWFWKLYVTYIVGFGVGKFVIGDENIPGIIESHSGDSINDKIFGFDVNITWGEPLQGDDIKYHIYGSYELKDLKKNNIISYT